MLALNVLRQYIKLHVFIVRPTDSKYAQRRQVTTSRRNQRGLMRPPAQALAGRTSEITYPGAAEHIRAVRAHLRPLLADCPMADDVILCVSELAANAARHSNSSLQGGAFTVRAVISPCDHVRIEVEDNGGPWTPVANDIERHHGLDIIRILATDWGIDGDHASRTAWARFEWPARS